MEMATSMVDAPAISMNENLSQIGTIPFVFCIIFSITHHVEH